MRKPGPQGLPGAPNTASVARHGCIVAGSVLHAHPRGVGGGFWETSRFKFARASSTVEKTRPFARALCGVPLRLQVGTEHVLLGLVAEDSLSKHGYLNSGLSLEAAKTAVEALSGRRRPLATNDAIPFSREVRRNFELATNVSGSDNL